MPNFWNEDFVRHDKWYSAMSAATHVLGCGCLDLGMCGVAPFDDLGGEWMEEMKMSHDKTCRYMTTNEGRCSVCCERLNNVNVPGVP